MDADDFHTGAAFRAWILFAVFDTATGEHPDRLLVDQAGRAVFGYLTDRMIRRGAHKNVKNLEAEIRAWIKNWNDDPKPCIWTRTAEQIVDSLAGFCQRISDAGRSPALARSRERLTQFPARAIAAAAHRATCNADRWRFCTLVEPCTTLSASAFATVSPTRNTTTAFVSQAAADDSSPTRGLG